MLRERKWNMRILLVCSMLGQTIKTWLCHCHKCHTYRIKIKELVLFLEVRSGNKHYFQFYKINKKLIDNYSWDWINTTAYRRNGQWSHCLLLLFAPLLITWPWVSSACSCLSASGWCTRWGDHPSCNPGRSRTAAWSPSPSSLSSCGSRCCRWTS